MRFRSKILRVELAADEYFRTLAQQVAAGADESHPRVRLFLNDRPLDPYDTLKTVPVAITDFIGTHHHNWNHLLPRRFLADRFRFHRRIPSSVIQS